MQSETERGELDRQRAHVRIINVTDQWINTFWGGDSLEPDTHNIAAAPIWWPGPETNYAQWKSKRVENNADFRVAFRKLKSKTQDPSEGLDIGVWVFRGHPPIVDNQGSFTDPHELLIRMELWRPSYELVRVWFEYYGQTIGEVFVPRSEWFSSNVASVIKS